MKNSGLICAFFSWLSYLRTLQVVACMIVELRPKPLQSLQAAEYLLTKLQWSQYNIRNWFIDRLERQGRMGRS